MMSGDTDLMVSLLSFQANLTSPLLMRAATATAPSAREAGRKVSNRSGRGGGGTANN
jgi:hypothetical protein